MAVGGGRSTFLSTDRRLSLEMRTEVAAKMTVEADLVSTEEMAKIMETLAKASGTAAPASDAAGVATPNSKFSWAKGIAARVRRTGTGGSSGSSPRDSSPRDSSPRESIKERIRRISLGGSDPQGTTPPRGKSRRASFFDAVRGGTDQARAAAAAVAETVATAAGGNASAADEAPKSGNAGLACDVIQGGASKSELSDAASILDGKQEQDQPAQPAQFSGASMREKLQGVDSTSKFFSPTARRPRGFAAKPCAEAVDEEENVEPLVAAATSSAAAPPAQSSIYAKHLAAHSMYMHTTATVDEEAKGN